MELLGARAQRGLVIGAGTAGLSTAFELVAQFHDVTVLEARTRPGGASVSRGDDVPLIGAGASVEQTAGTLRDRIGHVPFGASLAVFPCYRPVRRTLEDACRGRLKH